MLLATASDTEALGARLAADVRPGDVVALFGDLGTGKTTLSRGLLRALGFQGDVASPTFPIIQPYDELRPPVWHVDLYRIEEPSELSQLGLDEAREEVAMLIEWPERLGAALWADALRLRLSMEPHGGRALTAQVPPAWEGRWPPR